VVEQNHTVVRRLAAVPTAAGLAARLAMQALRRNGIDPAPLLARAGLTVHALEHRIDARSQVAFLDLAARAAGDEFLGLTIARDFDLRELGMLYYVTASSRSFGDALRRLERYVRVGNESVIARIRTGPICRVGLSYAGVPRHLDCHQIEFFALALVRLCRQLVGRRISPLNANFMHHRSGDLTNVRDLLGCEVTFGADADDLGLDPALLDQTLMSEDPFLNRLMIEGCEEALASRPTNAGPFRTIIENTIAPLLPHGDASARQVAGRLGLSERTFARRLSSEGLSFGVVLDELRRDLAMRYLEEPDLQISQIAWLLGFQQPSALSHACQRWIGKSPSQYRSGLSLTELKSAV
jgi:AraC-like DNA-binding protein